jgi:hypothetical protein
MSKLIVENSSNIVRYILADNQTVTARSNGTWTVSKPGSGTIDFGIGDLGSGNSTVLSNISTVPSGAIGSQYTYSGGTWTQVSGWVDPEIAFLASIT